MDNWFDKNKFFEHLIVLSWVFFLFFCLFLLSITSHGATVSGPQFPILVDNQIDVTPYQTYINNTYGGFWNLSQDNVIGWGSQENGYFVQTFAIPQVPDQIQGYLTFSPGGLVGDYPDFDYNNNTITLTFTNLANDNYRPWRLITFYTNGNNGAGYPYSAAFNTAGTINKGVYGNTGAKLNYISSDIYLTNNGAWVVNMPIFVSEIPVTPAEIGTAIIPTGLFTPDLSDITPPDKVPPKYTPSNYTWTQRPSLDNSSTDSLLSSIFGIIEWGMVNIDGEFNTLKNNLNGWFSYLGDLLVYYLNGIVDSINGGIQNLYENMSNLIQPIFDKIAYITEPIDTTAISSALSSSDVGQLVSLSQTYYNYFNTYFTSIPQRDSLIIRIPYTVLTAHDDIVVDFSWYDNIRSDVVPWIVGFLYAGFGLALFRSIPSIVHGLSGISQKGA